MREKEGRKVVPLSEGDSLTLLSEWTISSERVRGVTNSKEGEYGIKPPPHPLRTSGQESESSDLNFSRKTTSKFFTSFAKSSVR